MKVKELKEILNRQHINDDMDISIRIETPGGYMCPDGAVCNVKSIVRGIDWHGCELLIIPTCKLKLTESGFEDWKKGI